jgi:MerR family transcriptional regulator, thiopeptide resistance regulator
LVVETGLKVGQLAKRTGISVRTLHYYDELGLLPPSGRTDAGYRLYTHGDIARLQQIRSLQYLGLSLADVAECLARPDSSLLGALEMQIARLNEQIEQQQQLRAGLEGLVSRLRHEESISVEDLTRTMEVMKRMEQYYTPEQLEYLRRRREQVGEERIREVETTAWPDLIAEVRAAVDQGLDPASSQARELAERWMALVQEFTGGDPGIERSLGNIYKQEQPKDIHPAMDPRMREYMAFIQKARAASQ